MHAGRPIPRSEDCAVSSGSSPTWLRSIRVTVEAASRAKRRTGAHRRRRGRGTRSSPGARTAFSGREEADQVGRVPAASDSRRGTPTRSMPERAGRILADVTRGARQHGRATSSARSCLAGVAAILLLAACQAVPAPPASPAATAMAVWLPNITDPIPEVVAKRTPLPFCGLLIGARLSPARTCLLEAQAGGRPAEAVMDLVRADRNTVLIVRTVPGQGIETIYALQAPGFPRLWERQRCRSIHETDDGKGLAPRDCSPLEWVAGGSRGPTGASMGPRVSARQPAAAA